MDELTPEEQAQLEGAILEDIRAFLNSFQNTVNDLARVYYAIPSVAGAYLHKGYLPEGDREVTKGRIALSGKAFTVAQLQDAIGVFQEIQAASESGNWLPRLSKITKQ